MTSKAVAAGLILSTLAACGGSADITPVDTGTNAEAVVASATTAVRGIAADAVTGVRLAGVVISDGHNSTTTAANGTYHLDVTAGALRLTAKKSSYVTKVRHVTVSSSTTATVRFFLTPDCTYTYSAWSACSSSNIQTRTVIATSPVGCSGTPVLTQSCTPIPPPTGTAFKVFANNNLGMHCVDKSFSVFSILPPYNVADAQVVALQSTGLPKVLDATQVDVRYSAVADSTGSVNSTSIGKSDFWTYAQELYGASLAPGEGLQGMWMPADAPSSSGDTLEWSAALGLYEAPGIPIFPADDAGKTNRYPLMRFSAYDKSGNALGSSDIVLPVSEETSCQSCHATGKAAAQPGAGTWSSNPDLEAQARENVLKLHNAKLGTNLTAPVLCASCHYSPALDLAGAGQTGAQVGNRTMSNVMHSFHSNKMVGLADAPVPVGGAVPSPATQACYQCHPGTTTQCLRGAMTTKVDCQNCHGDMAAVGGLSPLRAGGSIDGTNDGKARRPWLDLPRCQSCHANDATTKTTVANAPPLSGDGLRFVNAYANGDKAASPILATNKRFAEETGKLFRMSKGHGGLACEACHGSTHAIWAAGGNDDVEATQLQGHAGTIAECSACHQAAPPNGLNGPAHGMHPVGSSWVSAHPNYGESQLASCRACHGADDRGTVLSRMSQTRTLAGRTLTAGTMVGCYTCHNGPNP